MSFIKQLLSHSDYNSTKTDQNGKIDADFPDVDYLHKMKEHFCDWLNGFIISDAKVFRKMSNCLRPSSRFLDQSNFFLWERAKSEL